MKILTVAFMLLFNYLDTLPKLYHKCVSATHTISRSKALNHWFRDKNLSLSQSLPNPFIFQNPQKPLKMTLHSKCF